MATVRGIKRKMAQPKRYSMAWYKKREEDDLKLRSKLLKNTIKNKDETATEWLARVNALYQKQTKIKRG